MAKRPLPTPTKLRQLLRYEPDTGKLFWLRRPLTMFSDGTRYSAERNWKIWNTRYADKEALCSPDNRGYLGGTLKGYPAAKAHRIIWAILHGEWPSGEIDHINGDRTDNRSVNLRVVTGGENQRNRCISRNNKSGQTGVAFRSGARHVRSPWRAYIKLNRRMIELGQFNTFEEAVAARKDAEARLGFHENHGRAP